MLVFLYHCISDGNQLFSENVACHFILHVMSDKAAFVSGALFCVHRYRGNIDFYHSNSTSCWQIIHLHIYAATNSASLWDCGINAFNCISAIHVIMLELKNNKHNTYYCCTYLYIVNAVIFKLLLASYLKRDLAKKKNNNNNITSLICLAISVRAKVLHDPLVQYSRGLNWYSNIDKLAVLARGGAILKQSKLFANHNTLGQLTNHNTFRFSECRPSSNPELIESFVSGWGERYCNNVNCEK